METKKKKENEIVTKVQKKLKENVLETRIPRERRISLHVKREAFKEAVKYLVDQLEFTHLSTITVTDLEDKIELIYHLAWKGSIELSLKIIISSEKPKVPTITDIIPGAVLYEREVRDVMGVTFEGHPDLSPLILPEEWPEDLHPLKKRYKIEELQEITEQENRENGL